MAADCATAMQQLGHSRFFVCGHDRGGRVAHQLAIDYAPRVTKLMTLDIVPTLRHYELTDQQFATAYWHWFFLIQPRPFPEEMILANPVTYSRRAFRELNDDENVFKKEAMREYEALFRDEAGVHAMCEDYRAGASVDLEHQREDRKEGSRIGCEMFAMWGTQGLIPKYDAVKEWQEICEKEVKGEGVDCGHYIPEEKPEELLKKMLEFFV